MKSTQGTNRFWRAGVWAATSMVLIVFVLNVTSCSLSTALNGGMHYAVSLPGAILHPISSPKLPMPVPGILFNRDSFALTYRVAPSRSGSDVGRQGIVFRWQENRQLGIGMIRVYFAPLLALFSVLPLIAFFRSPKRRWRIPPGHCKRCRYDLTGNTSGVCPECGMAVHSDTDVPAL